MSNVPRIALEALPLPVAKNGAPYYEIADFARLESGDTMRVVTDLAECLHAAVVRVQLANAEGDPILSAWLPTARAALTEAWRGLPSHRRERGGAA